MHVVAKQDSFRKQLNTREILQNAPQLSPHRKRKKEKKKWKITLIFHTTEHLQTYPLRRRQTGNSYSAPIKALVSVSLLLLLLRVCWLACALVRAACVIFLLFLRK
jgi:hypothetical protein